MLFVQNFVVPVLVYVVGSCVFQDLVVQDLVHVFSPRLGCPSCGLCCVFPDLVVQVLVHVLFSKTRFSKFWFVAFFQDLVVQVLVHDFFPRLGCPSCGSCLFFQDLVVQVVVYVVFSKTWLSEFWFTFCFPRLGFPSFGSCFFQDLVVQVLVCCIIVQLIVQVLGFVFAKTWLSKFWFVVLARLGCSSFGLLFVQDLFFVVGSFFPGLGCGSFSKSLSLSVQRHREGLSIRLRTLFFVFQVLVDVSSTVFEFNGVCSKMLICINLQAVVLHLLLHRRRRRLGGVS